MKSWLPIHVFVAVQIVGSVYPKTMSSGQEPCEFPLEAPAGAAAYVPTETSVSQSDVPHWSPNMEMLEYVMSFDISYNAAVRGLYATGNTSGDDAMCWVVEHMADEDLNEAPKIPGFDAAAGTGSASAADYAKAMAQEPETYKMIIVVNSSLKMGTGKIVSQAGHAVLALYRSMLNLEGNVLSWLTQWEFSGARKIAVKAPDTNALHALQDQAHSLGLPTMMISDAGRTQVAPGSITTLAVFGPTSQVDKVTGGLKLL